MRSLSLFQLTLFGAVGAAASALSGAPKCSIAPNVLSLSAPPYKDFFYSDCNVQAQVEVTSPLPGSNLVVIGPRLVVAWPAGDSGACAFFAPHNAPNGTLGLEVVNSTIGKPLAPAYTTSSSNSTPPSVGVQFVLRMNHSAVLTLPILGSIRTIRDFTEGPSLLHPIIQDANNFTQLGTGAQVSRLWLDNVTTTTLNFKPWGSSNTSRVTVGSQGGNATLNFQKGDYLVTAQMNYPQMTQLLPTAVLNSQSQGLVTSEPSNSIALSFMSYSEKLVAGAWRFLTYFGRDSMISALLMEPILSQGNGSAMEAVLGAVMERINRTTGIVCHEETIGDYATFTNMENGIYNNSMGCTYIMIDVDYYLPVLMQRYFLQSPVGQKRWKTFLQTPAGSIDTYNIGVTWGQQALRNAEYIMDRAKAFYSNQTRENLLHIEADQIVGNWRDSTYGIGGGRIPYDVNTGLCPAALRSIAALSRAGVYPQHKEWGTLADEYAQVWEDETLRFFEVTVPQKEAKARVTEYTNRTTFVVPDEASAIDSDVLFHAISLDGNNDLSKVEVMNTDDCFRHFLLNTTNQAQLTSFVNQTASNIRRAFPAGLLTSVGMLVANPAFGANPVYAQNWTTGAYHGTVVWSWPMAMMAKGLELQMSRCDGSTSAPDFCADSSVYNNVKAAYNTLWDTIEANSNDLSTEMWSWAYVNGEYELRQLAIMPPPPDDGTQTESDIRQLWSLSFMAVTRNHAY